MQAVRLIAPGTPLVQATLPDPEPGPGEVVVRVEASGICHSDAHYRAGDPATRALPITLGHEIAGTIVAAGGAVDADRVGRRVAVHYVESDGTCDRCRRYGEQFCARYQMYGLTKDGGYAEMIAVPAGNAVTVPDGVPIEHAAVMMCSSATSLHALRKGRLSAGDTVAVFGVGGLGMSAIQIAFALGAGAVYAVDIDERRLGIAADLGATPLPAGDDVAPAVAAGGGADVALVLVDRADAFLAALASLATRGRLVSVGIGRTPIAVVPYANLILGEHELIGSNDHLLDEIHELFAIAERGALDLTPVVTDRIPLEADAVNEALDRLDRFGRGVRTVITPSAS